MEITAIIVKSNGHAYLESLWINPADAWKELTRLQNNDDLEDDVFTIETQEVQ